MVQTVKNLPAKQENPGSLPGSGSIPGSERSPEKVMANQSSILAQKIPGTEEPGGPQSMKSQRVGYD